MKFIKRTTFQITGIVPVICFLLMMGSCNLYKEVEVTELTEIKIGEVTEEGVQVEIFMEVKNPNGYSVSLTKSHVDVFLEGNRLGELVLAEKIKIPKNSTSTQVLKMDADYDKLQGVLGNVLLLLFKKEFNFEAKGYVKGRALMIGKKVPVDFKETLTKEEMGF